MLLHSTISLVAKVIKLITAKLIKNLIVKLCHPDVVLMTIFTAREEKSLRYWRCKWNHTQGYPKICCCLMNVSLQHRWVLCIVRFWQFSSVVGSGFSVSLNYGLIQGEYSAVMDSLPLDKVTAFSQNYKSEQVVSLPHLWLHGADGETFV